MQTEASDAHPVTSPRTNLVERLKALAADTCRGGLLADARILTALADSMVVANGPTQH